MSVLLCEECTRPAIWRCGKCRMAYYCSKECQAEHWKREHREHCFDPNLESVGIKMDQRHFAAARRISGQEMIYLDTHIKHVMFRLYRAMQRGRRSRKMPRTFFVVEKGVDTLRQDCYRARSQPNNALFFLHDDGIYLLRCRTESGNRNDEMREIARDLSRYANAIVHWYDMQNLKDL